jgi:O-antigen/teichoic acid export membrane protein
VPSSSRAAGLLPDEGRRVLENAASIGTFVLGPLLLALMSRALGRAGYGRWWWTFGLLEGTAVVGMLATDLFIRREVPRLILECRERDIADVVGSSIAVTVATGLVTAVALCVLAAPLAGLQRDSELGPFIIVLSLQPLLWNLATVLTAVLQSKNVLRSVATLRGVAVPMLQAIALGIAYWFDASTQTTLLLLLLVSAAAVVLLLALATRHFSVGEALAHALRPRRWRQALRYGLPLVAPLILWTLGLRLDLYVLGAHVDPALLGVYGACLQLSGMIPSIRALFDPVVQRQIGALHTTSSVELGESLRRSSRLCALTIAAPCALLISVGEPTLSFLLGRPVPEATIPLIIMSIGQLVANTALASWLAPMVAPGRVVAMIAALTLVVKLALLLVLVPHFSLLGAAVASAAGAVIALHGQAFAGSKQLAIRTLPGSAIAISLIAVALGIVGRIAYVSFAGRFAALELTVVIGGTTLLIMTAAISGLLNPSEREFALSLIRLRRRR